MSIDGKVSGLNSLLAAKTNRLARTLENNSLINGNSLERTPACDTVSFTTKVESPVETFAKYCAKSTKDMKEYYDKLYGKDNWEYISLGRSCSKIAQGLDELGVKAHIIPISGLTKDVQNGGEIVSKNGFEEFRNYIYSLGLTPENIENSGKKYIFQDYSDSGATLKRFEEFIKTPEMNLGKENVIFQSINSVLEGGLKATSLDDYRAYSGVMGSFKNQTHCKSMKTYTNTKQLYVDNLKDITRGITDNINQLNDEFEEAFKRFLKTL